MNGEDILFAMTSLGFENYGEALKIYLARYREVSTYEIHEVLLRPRLTFNRILLPVASTSVLVNQVLREKPVLLTTAPTTPSLSGTLWIHPRKVLTTSPATRSRISLSIRGDNGNFRDHEPNVNICEFSYLFDVFMLLLDYPWSANSRRQGSRSR